MSNSNSNIKSSDDIGISKSTFFAGSLAAFSSGIYSASKIIVILMCRYTEAECIFNYMILY